MKTKIITRFFNLAVELFLKHHDWKPSTKIREEPEGLVMRTMWTKEHLHPHDSGSDGNVKISVTVGTVEAIRRTLKESVIIS